MRPIILVALVLTALGCRDCGGGLLNPTLPPDVRVDLYTQQAASKIDVLWVVDNSGSMAPRQENLANNFQAFMSEFTRNAIDFRIGITTTDIFREQGRFVGAPPVLATDTPSVIDAFKRNIRVGIDGSPYEVGLSAARMALDRQAAENLEILNYCKNTTCAGTANNERAECLARCDADGTNYPFLRTDAYLYIIFVTDEEDRSSEDVRYFYRYFETVKGVGNDGMVTTAAIMGDVPGNSCGATPGARYKALSDLTGGEVGSICDQNFSVTLERLAQNAVGLKRKFALQVAPNISTIEVRVMYPCNASAEKTANCASIDKTACTDAPLESLGVVCTPRAGEPNGWVYEEANQVIYFSGDSVPNISSTVEIEYYEEGKGPQE